MNEQKVELGADIAVHQGTWKCSTTVYIAEVADKRFPYLVPCAQGVCSQ